MNRIVEYPIEITNVQTLRLPRNTKVLSLKKIHSQILIVALVTWNGDYEDHKDQNMNTVEIDIYKTDDYVPDDHGKYVDTFFTHSGQMTWHVFMRELNSLG